MPSLFPLQANATTRALVEPHASALEAVCSAMEAAGVGVDPKFGHVHVLRRMSDSMRAEAAAGKVPNSWHDSMYAGAEKSARKPVTFSPMVSSLLARASIVLPEGDAKLSISQIDAALSAANLPVDKRIMVKNELAAHGLLASTDRRISTQGRL